MGAMQPKIRSAVHCVDGRVGEVAHVIADPFSLDLSHIVVRTNGTDRQVPLSMVGHVEEDSVELLCNAGELAGFPVFIRENFISSKEVEIPHLEEKIHVEPGEIYIPFPELEKSIARRSFFAGFTTLMGVLIGLPLIWPVLRYIMKPMYAPFDNRWWKVGNVSKIKQDDLGVQFIFKKSVKDSVLNREDDKQSWLVKASPDVLKRVYAHGDMTFLDNNGNVVWVNKATVPYVAFSGKCPHLGCGYKWRTHKVRGQVFLCPCHLSIYDTAGKVLDGPAPRPLDVLPIKVSAAGEIEVIDIEYKAGTRQQVRIA
jgi:Rieske Fe-S protein